MTPDDSNHQCVAFIGLDSARFLGWLPEYGNAVLVVRDKMGLEISRPTLELPAEQDSSGTLALLSHHGTLPFLREHGVKLLVVFKPSFRVQQWAEENQLHLVSGDCGLGQRLENKTQFSKIATESGLRVPRQMVFSGSPPLWSEISQRFGSRIVLQKARGHSGQGTFFISSGSEWADHFSGRTGRGAWKVAEFIEGETWTFNGAMWPSGDCVLGESYRQRTGDPLCTANPLGACGNVWGEPAPESLAAVREDIVQFLKNQHFTGPFGVDVLVPDDGTAAQIIEINSRSTSGLSMEAYLTKAKGGSSLAEAVMDACLDVKQRTKLSGVQLKGAQAVIYSFISDEIQMTSDVVSGTYRNIDGEVQFVSKNANPAVCSSTECVVLARSKGQWIGAQGELARLQVCGAETDLHPWIHWINDVLRS